ncbi:MAG: hypothetical protein EBZ51_09440 [Synechococcaceae bacterium WB9_2_112]|nr:hypothetical protein [Synechococcaceae bacterium WB9_2_112]
MARVTTELSADDLSRLIDGLDGTGSDTTPAERAHTEELLHRLCGLFVQVNDQELKARPSLGY